MNAFANPSADDLYQIFPEIFQLALLPGIAPLVVGNSKYLFFEKIV